MQHDTENTTYYENTSSCSIIGVGCENSSINFISLYHGRSIFVTFSYARMRMPYDSV